MLGQHLAESTVWGVQSPRLESPGDLGPVSSPAGVCASSPGRGSDHVAGLAVEGTTQGRTQAAVYPILRGGLDLGPFPLAGPAAGLLQPAWPH